MLKSGRRRVFGVGVGFWAFLFSIGVHGLLFVMFSFVSVSGGGSVDADLQPASISVVQIQKSLSRPAVIPKPKIKRVEVGTGKKALQLDLHEKEKLDYSQDYAAAISGQLEGGLLAGQFESSSKTEFFGSTTNLRKICYVVDASGSMQGRLGMVRKQLKRSIEKLGADQYFYVIFFRGDGLVELGGGKLVRATAKSKLKAYEFFDGVRFEGPTNAISAIDRSMRVKDSAGRCVQQIYFLSDGFDFKSDNSADFAEMIKNMRKRLAPSVRINTIGVWVQQQDAEILRSIAAGSGGQYVGLE
jgi:hypothetical protein